MLLKVTRLATLNPSSFAYYAPYETQESDDNPTKWNLDSLLSAINKIMVIAPNVPREHCQPRIHGKEEATIVSGWNLWIDSDPSARYQYRQGIYRDGHPHPKLSILGCQIHYESLAQAKEDWNFYCERDHKLVGNSIHICLSQEAQQKSRRLAELARIRLLRQELQALFPKEFIHGEGPLPSLNNHANFLQRGVHKSALTMGDWSLFVVYEDGVAERTSLHAAIICAQDQVRKGKVVIAFAQSSFAAQQLYVTLTGSISLEEQEQNAHEEDDRLDEVRSLDSVELEHSYGSLVDSDRTY
ncbi:hypothetical protein E1B28_001900 [Marasmius oreades]|uniref:Uncharacterized protein n=1 Tax=Marasmius oreades TaxID=181124 RepID=A0A9P7V4B3_9AGAR|nr:uncharacterized protein E1B28_001900 [Marasmius oreades]KAG7100120.1 hypothetical protein E1B28_001900 [Marasmius oreades]